MSKHNPMQLSNSDEQSDNLKFFEEDSVSTKKTRYISRLFLALHNKFFIKNLFKTCLLVVIFSFIIIFTIMFTTYIVTTVDNNKLNTKQNFIVLKNIITKDDLNTFNEILEQPVIAHQNLIEDYTKNYLILTLTDNKAKDKTSLFKSPERLSSEISETRKRVSKIKADLLPFFQYDSYTNLSSYNENNVKHSVEKYLAIKNGSLDVPKLMTRDYHSLINTNETIKNMLFNNETKKNMILKQ